MKRFLARVSILSVAVATVLALMPTIADATVCAHGKYNAGGACVYACLFNCPCCW